MIKLCAFADEAGDSLESQIEALKRNDIKYIEIRNINGINVQNFELSFAEEVYEKLKENDIEVFSIGSPLCKVDIDVDIDKYFENEFKHILKIAKVMHTKRVRMFSFYHSYQNEEMVVKYLNRLATYALKEGIMLCHENEKDIYGDSLERVKILMNNVKDLHFVYDPANFIQSKENINDCLNELVNKVDYYHIKDIDSKLNIVPAGYGNGEIMRLLNSIEKDTVLTVEPHLQLFSGYSSLDNTELKNDFIFKDLTESFDCAVESLKKCLKDCNYIKKEDGYIKNE